MITFHANGGSSCVYYRGATSRVPLINFMVSFGVMMVKFGAVVVGGSLFMVSEIAPFAHCRQSSGQKHLFNYLTAQPVFKRRTLNSGTPTSNHGGLQAVRQALHRMLLSIGN
jgi:hypothetical protein